MNLFELMAKISLDTKDYDSGVKESESKFAKLASGIKTGAVAMAKAAAAGLTAVAGATTALGTSAVKAYGDYEQLVGGVNKMFGASQQAVLENAEKAYQSAGLSVNEYLDTITSFSASLVQGLTKTTEKAYDINVEAETEALQEQYSIQKDAYTEQYDALKESLDAKHAALSDAYDAQIDALKESNDAQIEEITASNEQILDAMRQRNNDEISEFQRATDEKIALINKEYAEQLKLVDAEAYKQQQALQEQIDVIQAEVDATKAAEKAKTEEKRKQQLLQKVNKAKTDQERQDAEEAYNDYVAKLEAEALAEQRKAQIYALKQQQKDLSDAAKEKKAALQEQYKAEEEEYKKARSTELAALKDAQNKELESVKKAQAEQLKAKKDANATALAEAQKAAKAQLEQLKKQNDKELKQLKTSNQQKLAAQKEYVKSQTKVLEKMGEAEKTVTVDAAEAQAKAAELADLAIRDMADNANMYGTAISSLQTAYAGFAKQNYTMLDNLKLGYGGTKEEMERLIADANQLREANGEMANLTISSFADIVQAVHEIQVSMNIAGTTQKEAAGTITGSIGAATSAWKNLVLELGKEAPNLSGKLGEFEKAGSQAFENVANRVNVFADNLSLLLTDVLPNIIDSIPQEVDKESNISKVIGAGKRLFSTLVTGVKVAIPRLAEAGRNAIDYFVSWFTDGNNISNLGTAALSILKTLGNNIIKKTFTMADSAVEIIKSFVGWFASGENLTHFFKAAKAFISSFSSEFLRFINEHGGDLAQIGLDLLDAIIALTSKSYKLINDVIIGTVQAICDVITGEKSNTEAMSAGEKFGYAVVTGIGTALEGAGKIIAAKLTDGVADAVHEISVMLNTISFGLIPETDYTKGEYEDFIRSNLEGDKQKAQLERWNEMYKDIDEDAMKKAQEMAKAAMEERFGGTLTYNITVNAAGASAAETADAIKYDLEQKRLMGMGG